MKKIFTLLAFSILSVSLSQAQCSFTMNVTFNNPTCHGFSDGSITIIATGGTGNLTFEVTDSVGNILNVGGVNAANNLSGGWYYISVTDQTPCTEIDSVFLVDPPEMDVLWTIANLWCYGDSTGGVLIDSVYNAQGSYSQVAYFWNPSGTGGQGIGANAQSGLIAGSYTVTINDDFGCSITKDFTISSPPQLVWAQLSSTNDSCGTNPSGVVSNGCIRWFTRIFLSMDQSAEHEHYNEHYLGWIDTGML